MMGLPEDKEGTRQGGNESDRTASALSLSRRVLCMLWLLATAISCVMSAPESFCPTPAAECSGLPGSGPNACGGGLPNTSNTISHHHQGHIVRRRGCVCVRTTSGAPLPSQRW